eukprot:CAMPEP_0116133302 /NCGR_PEP_ID=MMETSP0329-20121206/10031_1 /TAXON_ID=697910 /ORGANISM="Pseudo-nitzschia arenysensis, Strain B593" /LENGTH=472 /DNA_ID=CAMNT_0003627919 /DNA_START=126 /DNA_END=1544 /DNA_ORIENTATION=-
MTRIMKMFSGFVVIGVVLTISSVLGLSIGDPIKTAVGNGDHIGTENLSSVVGNLGEDSISHSEISNDYFQTNAGKLRATPGITSNTNTGQDETIMPTEGTESIFGTGDVSSEGFYGIKDPSKGEWDNHQGSFEQESGHRTLLNDTAKKVEGTLESININATSTEEENPLAHSKTIVGLTITLGVMAVLLSLLSWIFVYMYRKNSLVAIGQPPFLYLVCFGSLLLSSELFFLFRYLSMDQSIRDATCVAQLWFRNIGSVCVHMAIFCKLWRAYKVAQFRKNQVVLPKHVIVPFVVMLLAVIGVTIAQTITDPPEWQFRHGPDGTTVGMCLPGSVAALSMREMDLRIEITTGVLQLLCLSIMLIMAYVTRNIPEDISDARRVLWAVLSGILFSLATYAAFWIGVFAEVYFLSAISRSLRYFFDGIIFVAFLIVPKIFAVWRENRNKRNGARTNSTAATSSRGKGVVHVSGVDTA